MGHAGVFTVTGVDGTPSVAATTGACLVAVLFAAVFAAPTVEELGNELEALFSPTDPEAPVVPTDPAVPVPGVPEFVPDPAIPGAPKPGVPGMDKT
jgi:hypothetical protein